MERSDIACRTQPEGQCREALAVDFTIVAIRASCLHPLFATLLLPYFPMALVAV
jgi:hypothetical protein